MKIYWPQAVTNLGILAAGSFGMAYWGDASPRSFEIFLPIAFIATVATPFLIREGIERLYEYQNENIAHGSKSKLVDILLHPIL